MGILRLFKFGIKKTIRIVKDALIKRLPIYYESITKMPVYNWFEIKSGNFKALYQIKLWDYIPSFFDKVALNMFYEFDVLDLTLLRKKADHAFMDSIAKRTNDLSLQFQADVLKKDIERQEEKKGEEVTLNKFIDYIEITFNCVGTIDPFKISTSRAFSLYNKAVQKNENNKAKCQ